MIGCNSPACPRHFHFTTMSVHDNIAAANIFYQTHRQPEPNLIPPRSIHLPSKADRSALALAYDPGFSPCTSAVVVPFCGAPDQMLWSLRRLSLPQPDHADALHQPGSPRCLI